MGRQGQWVFVVFWYQDEVLNLAGAHVAQLVERVLGKDEVISSILIMGSSNALDCVRQHKIAYKHVTARKQIAQ